MILSIFGALRTGTSSAKLPVFRYSPDCIEYLLVDVVVARELMILWSADKEGL